MAARQSGCLMPNRDSVSSSEFDFEIAIKLTQTVTDYFQDVEMDKQTGGKVKENAPVSDAGPIRILFDG